MNDLKSHLTIPDEKRVLSPEERGGFHCSRVVAVENWNRIPCDLEAVVVFEIEPGYRMGFCARHRAEGQKHAEFRGWVAA